LIMVVLAIKLSLAYSVSKQNLDGNRKLEVLKVRITVVALEN
jgi:hypothetical protein